MTRHIGARHTVFSNMLNRHSLYYTASSMVWFPAQWAQEGCQCTLIMPRVTVHFGLGLSPCFPTWQFSLSWRVSRLCKTHFKLLPSKRLPPCDWTGTLWMWDMAVFMGVYAVFYDQHLLALMLILSVKSKSHCAKWPTLY